MLLVRIKFPQNVYVVLLLSSLLTLIFIYQLKKCKHEMQNHIIPSIKTTLTMQIIYQKYFLVRYDIFCIWFSIWSQRRHLVWFPRIRDHESHWLWVLGLWVFQLSSIRNKDLSRKVNGNVNGVYREKRRCAHIKCSCLHLLPSPHSLALHLQIRPYLINVALTPNQRRFLLIHTVRGHNRKPYLVKRQRPCDGRVPNLSGQIYDTISVPKAEVHRSWSNKIV